MTDENLELATKVMGEYINSKDPKGHAKEALMKLLGFEEDMAAELADAAYKEWMEAYGG
jgi:hypothetical protein